MIDHDQRSALGDRAGASRAALNAPSHRPARARVVLALLVMLVALVAGCSGSGSGPGATSTSGAVARTPAAATPTPRATRAPRATAAPTPRATPTPAARTPAARTPAAATPTPGATAAPAARTPAAATPTPRAARTATPAPSSRWAAQPPDDWYGDTVGMEELPPEALDTLELVVAGGPYPYDQDDGIFGNREGILPDRPSGTYREYTVETPGSADRGARRLVIADGLQRYYSDDHYDTFRFVVP
jgi:ribonuclease T1